MVPFATSGVGTSSRGRRDSCENSVKRSDIVEKKSHRRGHDLFNCELEPARSLKCGSTLRLTAVSFRAGADETT